MKKLIAAAIILTAHLTLGLASPANAAASCNVIAPTDLAGNQWRLAVNSSPYTTARVFLYRVKRNDGVILWSDVDDRVATPTFSGTPAVIDVRWNTYGIWCRAWVR